MDPMKLAQSIESNLDEHYLYANYINSGNVNKGSLKTIIERNLVLRKGANVTQLTDYIKNKMYPYIKPLNDKELETEKFIESVENYIISKGNGFVESIVNSNGTVTNFKDFLRLNFNNGFINANNEVEVIYINETSKEKRVLVYSIDSIYDSFLEADKKMDKKLSDLETIYNYFYLISSRMGLSNNEMQNLLNTNYVDEQSFNYYLSNILPEMLDEQAGINVIIKNGDKVEEVQIDLFIKDAIEKVYGLYLEHKENLYNKINEDPSLIPEINEFGEVSLQVSDQAKELNDQLYNIKISIYNATTIDDLEELIERFNQYCSTVDEQLLIECRGFIDSIKTLIVEKQNNIIKRNNNMSDYIASIISRLNELNVELNNVTDQNEFIDVIYNLSTIKNEVYTNKIYNGEVTDKINEIEMKIEIKRHLNNVIFENLDFGKKSSYDNLDIMLEEINNKLVEYGLELNEIKRASIEVKINSLINSYNSLKNELYKNNVLSAEEVNLYSDKLNVLLNMEGAYKNER